MARRILDASYDAGVRHLDTANSYGFGQSERIIGDWLQTIDRGSVTIATKFGKAVEPQSSLQLWGRRMLSRPIKSLRRLLGRPRGTFTTVESDRKTIPHIDTEALRASVRQSLQSLRTEQLDVLHLHSASPESVTSQVRSTLASLVESGQVKFIGLATNRTDCEQLINDGLPVGVVQFPDSACWTHAVRWDADAAQVVVTHSVLGRDGSVRSALAGWLRKSEDNKVKWSDILGLDVSSGEGVAELLIRGALARNQTGGVLCGCSRVRQVAMLKRAIASPLNEQQALDLQQMFQRFAAEVAV
jgi:aryl-alcohol dehydrogenase-like predicted oxidoreductase